MFRILEKYTETRIIDVLLEGCNTIFFTLENNLLPEEDLEGKYGLKYHNLTIYTVILQNSILTML